MNDVVVRTLTSEHVIKPHPQTGGALWRVGVRGGYYLMTLDGLLPHEAYALGINNRVVSVQRTNEKGELVLVGQAADGVHAFAVVQESQCVRTSQASPIVTRANVPIEVITPAPIINVTVQVPPMPAPTVVNNIDVPAAPAPTVVNKIELPQRRSERMVMTEEEDGTRVVDITTKYVQ